jgi:transcription elongation GreA/GreB family factor
LGDERFARLEQFMSDMSAALQGLNDSISGVVDRIDEDVDHFRNQMQQLRSLLDEAISTKATDKAEVTRLTEQANAIVAQSENDIARIQAATAALNSIDPDSSNPTVPPVEEVTPPTEDTGGTTPTGEVMPEETPPEA